MYTFVITILIFLTTLSYAHPKFRAAVDAGNLKKVKSLLRLGVTDIYCGNFNSATSKNLFLKLWKNDLERAWENCRHQVAESYPELYCKYGKTELYSDESAAAHCMEILSDLANEDRPNDYLRTVNALLSNKVLMSLKEPDVHYEKIVCEPWFEKGKKYYPMHCNNLQCENSVLEYPQKLLFEEGILTKFGLTIDDENSDELSEFLMKQCKSKPYVWHYKNEVNYKYNWKRRISEISNKAIMQSDNPIRWISTLKSLKKRLPLLFSPDRTFRKNFVKRNSLETGVFPKDTLELLCEIDPRGMKSLFSKFDNIGNCPLKCNVGKNKITTFNDKCPLVCDYQGSFWEMDSSFKKCPVFCDNSGIGIIHDEVCEPAAYNPRIKSFKTLIELGKYHWTVKDIPIPYDRYTPNSISISNDLCPEGMIPANTNAWNDFAKYIVSDQKLGRTRFIDTTITLTKQSSPSFMVQLLNPKYYYTLQSVSPKWNQASSDLYGFNATPPSRNKQFKCWIHSLSPQKAICIPPENHEEYRNITRWDLDLNVRCIREKNDNTKQ